MPNRSLLLKAVLAASVLILTASVATWASSATASAGRNAKIDMQLSMHTLTPEFLRPALPQDREYGGFFMLRNSDGAYPDPPQMPIMLTRVRAIGETRNSIIVNLKGAMVDVTPALRPANDPECHYVSHLSAMKLPKGISTTKPIDLHLWIYERDTAMLASGQPDGSPDPSVMIYKKTFQIEGTNP